MSGRNREQVRAGGKGRAWCVCDRVVIGETRKCPICHRRNGRRRGKPKDAPSIEQQGVTPEQT